MKDKQKRMIRTYTQIAIYALNFLVLLFVVNVALAVLFCFRDARANDARANKEEMSRDVRSYREKYADLDAYSVLDEDTANQYLDEQEAMGKEGFDYKPWLQFLNREFAGSLLNVNGSGFRVALDVFGKNEDENLPPIRVYVFGGSTTFGYGVPDQYTIPAQLHAILSGQRSGRNISVENFGHGFYFSSQELMLFLSLLKSGDVPDYVVFVDGANLIASICHSR